MKMIVAFAGIVILYLSVNVAGTSPQPRRVVEDLDVSKVAPDPGNPNLWSRCRYLLLFLTVMNDCIQMLDWI